MGFRTHDLLLGKETYYHCTTPAILVPPLHLVQTESAETQNRTGDTAIFSRVLYQLSYLGQARLHAPAARLRRSAWAESYHTRTRPGGR